MNWHGNMEKREMHVWSDGFLDESQPSGGDISAPMKMTCPRESDL